jgi:phosphate-selective porin OprO/OprP
MRNRQRILSLIVAVTTATATGTSLLADDTNTVPASTIEQKIDALDQEIQALKRQRELDQEAAQQAADQAAEKAKAAPVITAGSNGLGPEGFKLESADSNFVLRVGGYAQADGRFYLHDTANNGVDTFLMRRVRPILEGTLYKDFDFRIMTDFGNGAAQTALLQDAYVEWHHWQWLKLRAGKFKPPTGLEWLESDTDLLFIERGLPTDLVPQRDVGIQLSGSILDGVISYAGGVFNGVVDGGIGDLDTTDAKDVAARVFFLPFKETDVSFLKGFGFGAGGTIGHEESTSTTTNLPTYKSVGQLTIFSYNKAVAPNGQELRYDPQAYYYVGPLGLLAEYNVSEQEVHAGAIKDNIQNSAWQVVGGFFLTGEEQKFRGSPYSPSGAVNPRHPFELGSGGWGAFELVARYGDLRFDPDAFNRNPTAGGARFANPIASVQEAREWGVGLNWYLNRNIKLSLDYDNTAFDGGAGSATTTAYDVKNRQTEQALFMQAQFAF